MDIFCSHIMVQLACFNNGMNHSYQKKNGMNHYQNNRYQEQWACLMQMIEVKHQVEKHSWPGKDLRVIWVQLLNILFCWIFFFFFFLRLHPRKFNFHAPNQPSLSSQGRTQELLLNQPSLSSQGKTLKNSGCMSTDRYVLRPSIIVRVSSALPMQGLILGMLSEIGHP